MATVINENNQYQTSTRMLRSKEVVNLTGLSRSSIWRLERTRRFPSRRRLSTGTVGWSLIEVEEWIASREAVVNA